MRCRNCPWSLLQTIPELFARCKGHSELSALGQKQPTALTSSHGSFVSLAAVLEAENGSHHYGKCCYRDDLACPGGLGSRLDRTTAASIWDVSASELVYQIEAGHLFVSFSGFRHTVWPTVDGETRGVTVKAARVERLG